MTKHPNCATIERLRQRVRHRGLPGALPRATTRRSARRRPLCRADSGTAFTAPRHANRRTWMYRLRPRRCTGRFRPDATAALASGADREIAPRRPTAALGSVAAADDADAISSTASLTMAANGDAASHDRHAASIVYAANRSMRTATSTMPTASCCSCRSRAACAITTELGVLEVEPRRDRGRSARRALRGRRCPTAPSRGYVCENYGAPFRLPELGLIGSNGLANARDFLAPVAAYEDARATSSSSRSSWAACGRRAIDAFAARRRRLARQLAPYKYDTARFMAIGSISFDHPDPSIFTRAAVAVRHARHRELDFVIFPPRWLVMEDTFRPPWFHRNVMSEFMGLVHGVYDAKAEGFMPGGASLHNCMVPHGPDAETFEKASHADLKPTSSTTRWRSCSRAAAASCPAVRDGRRLASARLCGLLGRAAQPLRAVGRQGVHSHRAGPS